MSPATYSLDSDNNILHLMPYNADNITENNIENIRKVLDDGNIAFEVFVDLRKTFDTLDH